MEGVLKGFDTLVNLVLDECVEFIRGASLLKPLQSPRRAPPPAWRRAPRAARRAPRAAGAPHGAGAADVDDPYKLTDATRNLGLIVCRGTAVTLVCPCDGMVEIANPFLQEGAEA